MCEWAAVDISVGAPDMVDPVLRLIGPRNGTHECLLLRGRHSESILLTSRSLGKGSSAPSCKATKIETYLFSFFLSIHSHIHFSQHTAMSNPQHPTSEPFTDPKQGGDGARQSAAKIVALPLAAAGGVITEVATKVKEFVTSHSTKIDTAHSSHERSASSITSSSQGSTST